MHKQLNGNNYQAMDGLIPAIEHKEPKGDDCGLPENPIFSNYSKYLWKCHSRNPRLGPLSRIRKDKGDRENIESFETAEMSAAGKPRL